MTLHELMEDMDPLDWEREDIAQKTNVAYQQVVRLSRDRRPKRSLKAAREPKGDEEDKKARRVIPRDARKPNHIRPKRFVKRCPSSLPGIPFLTLRAGRRMQSP